MQALSNKRILLGVSGGIAAYKSPDLVRRLRDAGADVRVVMTAAAQEFVTALTFQAASGNPVHTDLLDDEAEAGMGHIELARWADFIVIAPATANRIAALAQGFADDLLATLCLASEARLFVAPAMNQVMWGSPAVQDNVTTLSSRGATILGPGVGDQACGETGAGRMLEPTDIRDALIEQLSAPVDLSLAGRRVLITAGPTREALDPVRYIGNHSSGKMGFAVASAAARAGATVTMVAGPVDLSTPSD
ncbi:MAG: bifunctional phosphopantothenoylcysteine decarboxylase/phosphopantothenate--cysteine ligase CoaBC, partial [Pseudomonadota bacterium]